jgi:DNA-binding protein HU-beta
MSKKFIADVIKQSTDISGVAATRAAGDFLEALVAKIKTDGRLSIPGFGTFRVVETKARKGLNPRTGESLKIKAGKSVRFKASPTLKNAMKGRRAGS